MRDATYDNARPARQLFRPLPVTEQGLVLTRAHWADRKTTVAVVVVHVVVIRIEFEEPRAVQEVGAERTRPEVAVGTDFYDRSPVGW